MKSYIEIIYIDDEDNGRHTNLELELSTNAETWAAFNGFRKFAVPSGQSKFVLDYHTDRGLVDTIPIDRGGFIAITGRQPKSDAEYVKIDEDYWAAARKEHDKQKAAA